MMLSPGYTYDKAPDQEHFLGKSKTRAAVPPDSEQPHASSGAST